jgi:hypothetical protein
MALNPPIESLPIQETDRDGHLQRYLSGLPDFGSWQDQGEGKLGGLVQTRWADGIGPPTEFEKTGMDVIQDREVEAAERAPEPIISWWSGRNERKIRRREKAAILKPKPPSLSPAEAEELDQEWWDNYRAQKQGLLLDKDVEVLRNRDIEAEVERGEMIMEKKENRRLQQRIPKSKVRGKGKGIPGIEIIEAYKPMTTALGPRMTVSPIVIPLLPLCLPAWYFSPPPFFLVLLPNPALSTSNPRGLRGMELMIDETRNKERDVCKWQIITTWRDQPPGFNKTK